MMARALVTEDRIELGHINPLIGGSAADTLSMIRAAVAYIGMAAQNAAALDSSSIGCSQNSCLGEALLCSCIDTALSFEIHELSVVEVKLGPMVATGVATATAEIEIQTVAKKPAPRKRR